MRLPALTGLWAIDRHIADLGAGTTGRLTGRAAFRPAPEGLLYRETGTLTLGGTTMTASRSYLWRARAGRIEVLFDDGRPFHAFAADDPAPGAEHACGPDLYQVRYDFRPWPRWQAEWRVHGPRKDYLTVTRFTRPPGFTEAAQPLAAEA